MKRFISTKFILSLQEASQKEGTATDTQVLENDYNQFVMLLFQDTALFQNKALYHNTLIYTRVELAGLTKVSGKKCRRFSM